MASRHKPRADTDRDAHVPTKYSPPVLTDEMQREIERCDAGESIWSDEDEVVTLETTGPKRIEIVVLFGLSGEDWRKFEKEAQRLGLSTSDLARDWILERLEGLPQKG